MQGVQSLVWELRCHMPRGQNTKTWNKQCTKFNEVFKNGPHQKIFKNWNIQYINGYKGRNANIWISEISSPFPYNSEETQIPRLEVQISHCGNTTPRVCQSWRIRKDCDAGKDWRQEEKGTTEDEMAGWYSDPMDMSLRKLQEMVKKRETWHTAVHGVTKSQTRLSDWTESVSVMRVSHLNNHRYELWRLQQMLPLQASILTSEKTLRQIQCKVLT